MTRRSSRRALVALAATAALLPFGAGAAFAQDSFIDPADPCLGGAAVAPFDDRAAIPTAFLPFVDCAFENDITQGFQRGADLVFASGEIVNRDQMAAFIVRTLEAGGYELPAPTDQGFTDIAGNTFEDEINQIAALEITLGRTATTYVPGAPVNRDAMAAFLIRSAEFAFDGAGLTGFTDTNSFTDDTGNAFEDEINAISDLLGVAVGQGGGLYAPGQATQRGEMVTFLVRLLDVTLIPSPEAPDAPVPPAPPA